MKSFNAAQIIAHLSGWASIAVEQYDAVAVYLFGSLIHKDGAQFNESSDIDLVVLLPHLENAVARTRWLEAFLEHKDNLELSLLRLLKRRGDEPIVSVVAVTVPEIDSNIHKDGHQEFFTANTFLELPSNKTSVGIPKAGLKAVDRFASGCMAFTQKMRNEHFAVSPNGTAKMEEFNGADPLPKRIMRAAAMAARARNAKAGQGAEHDVQEGLDLLTNQLFVLRETDPRYSKVQDILSVRRRARGEIRALEPSDQVFLAEMIYDLVIPPNGLSPGSAGPSGPTQPPIFPDDNDVGFGTSLTLTSPVEGAFVPSWLQRTGLPAASTAAFFADRFQAAFPGSRKITWFDRQEEIALRLNALLAAPLMFDGATPIWWWRGGNLQIEDFRRLPDGTYLMNSEELNISRIAAVPGSVYHRHFVYIEVAPMEPTGLYEHSEAQVKSWATDSGYHYEEYGLFDGHMVTRAQYDDGGFEADGKLIDIRGMAELRVRYITPYNFIVAAQGSPINNPRFDEDLQKILNEGLMKSSEEWINKLSRMVDALPLRQ